MRLRLLVLAAVACVGPGHAALQTGGTTPQPQSAVANATPPSASAGRSVDSLAWMAGRWVGEMFGKPAEEHWTRPSAGTLVGMYRLGGSGDRPIYELILIEQEESGPVMRLRHFRAGFEPMEDAPLVLPLTQSGPNEATFENPQLDRPRKVVYRRSGDEMVIGLEFVNDGQSSYREYTLRNERLDVNGKPAGAE